MLHDTLPNSPSLWSGPFLKDQSAPDQDGRRNATPEAPFFSRLGTSAGLWLVVAILPAQRLKAGLGAWRSVPQFQFWRLSGRSAVSSRSGPAKSQFLLSRVLHF